MDEREKSDIKISGSGSISGGTYGEISISGSGRISGDVECEGFHASGSAKGDGSLKAGRMKLAGSANITGGLSAEQIVISGSASAGGDVTAKEIAVSGSFHADGGLQGESINVGGGLHVGRDLKSESFVCSGSFAVGGTLNAGTIEIKAHRGKSRAAEIGGSKISVRREEGLPFGFQSLFSSGSPCLLETDAIEGDDIYLEYTRANAVRGGKIRLGPGCDIGTVEYSGSFEASDRSRVKENRKI